MMNNTMKKLQAMTCLKAKYMLSSLSLLIVPIISIAMVVIYKSLGPQNDASFSYVTLLYGFSFNTIMGGMMFGAYPIAEDKEKGMLRTLMTSSFTGNNYIIGSIIPSILILFPVNILLLILSRVSLAPHEIAVFLALSFLCLLISILIGFCVGIFSKNQTQAGVCLLAPALLITFAPTVAIMSQKYTEWAQWLYPYPVSKMVLSKVMGNQFTFGTVDIVSSVAWIVLSLLLFLFLYKKSGIDR